MSNEDDVIDDGLTYEERALDAQIIAAELGPVFAPMIQARREKAAKPGHRKRRARRFSMSALDGPDSFVSPHQNDDDPWDSPTPVLEEVRRIAIIVHTYSKPNSSEFRTDINKREMIDKMFDGRAQTTKNLLRLYAFMQTKSNGWRCLSSSPLFYLVEEILLKSGDIKESLDQRLTVAFGNELEEGK